MKGIDDPAIDRIAETRSYLEKALKEAKENSKRQYSLNEFENGRRFVDVKADQNTFNGLSFSEAQNKALEILRSRFVGKVIGIDNISLNLTSSP